MLRSTQMLVTAAGLAPEDIWDIGANVVAVRPSKLAAVVAAIESSNQFSFKRFLLRGYFASERTFSVGGCMAVLHKGAGNGGNASFQQWANTHLAIQPLTVHPNASQTSETVNRKVATYSYTLAPVTNAPGYANQLWGYKASAFNTGAVDVDFDNTSIIEAWTTTMNPTSVIKATSPNQFGGSLSLTDPGDSYTNAMFRIGDGFLVVGNVDQPGANIVLTKVGGLLVATKEDWPIICGPSALTRGEVYPSGFSWFAASCDELSLLIDNMIADAKDGNARARLVVQRNMLKTRDTDALVSVNISNAIAFHLLSTTKPHEKDLSSLDGLQGGYDFTVAKARKADGKPKVAFVPLGATASSFDPFPGSPAEMSFFFDQVSRKYTSTVGTISVESADFATVVTAIRLSGRTVSFPLSSSFVTCSEQEAADNADAVAALDSTTIGVNCSLSASAECDVVGTAVMNYMFGPEITDAKRKMFQMCLTPGYLDLAIL